MWPFSCVLASEAQASVVASSSTATLSSTSPHRVPLGQRAHQHAVERGDQGGGPVRLARRESVPAYYRGLTHAH